MYWIFVRHLFTQGNSIKYMRNYSIQEVLPYSDDFLLYVTLLEDDDGYVELQKYACLEAEHESVLASALSAFRASRERLDVDPLPRP